MNSREKKEQRIRRHKRIRARIVGTAERPRLSVFRSNQHVWVQLIDDGTGTTLVSAGDAEVKPKKGEKTLAAAGRVGELIAKRALEKKISAAVFDRGGYKYHGIVRAVAEGARKGGLRL